MNNVAKFLLESKSVYIEPNPEKFFKWTSGKMSPIYCDNRQLISYPSMRKQIVKMFVNHIREAYPSAQIIAGTATAGIPWAAWVSESLNLPMIYIRSKAKTHGRLSCLEGAYKENQDIIIIEDLISTAKSSIEASEQARNEKLNVLGVLSIFNYGLMESKRNFESHSLNSQSLCTIEALLDYAKEIKILDSSESDFILNWRNSHN